MVGDTGKEEDVDVVVVDTASDDNVVAVVVTVAGFVFQSNVNH